MAGGAVAAGDFVLLEGSDGAYQFVEAKAGGKVRVHKAQYAVEALIGAPYSATFHARGSALVRAAARGYGTSANDEGQGEAAVGVGGGRDNRDLVDDNKAQKVDTDQINEMRRAKASGEQIIGALIAGSESWDKKTEFARAKWLKRKEKKYMPWVRVLKPTAGPICRAYFARNPGKVRQLRPDSLAQLLAASNVHSGAQVACLDEVSGLVVGALCERLGGQGRVLAAYCGTHPAFDAVRRFNFDAGRRATIEPFHVSEVVVTPGGDDKLRPGSCSGLIVASSRDPRSVLEALLPLLAKSAPFAVFSEYQEPLTACHKWRVGDRLFVRRGQLQESPGIAVNLALSQSWLRDFQVLPNRTHPAMQMSADGGHILAGVYVGDLAFPRSPEPPAPSSSADEAASEPAPKKKPRLDDLLGADTTDDDPTGEPHVADPGPPRSAEKGGYSSKTENQRLPQAPTPS